MPDDWFEDKDLVFNIEKNPVFNIGKLPVPEENSKLCTCDFYKVILTSGCICGGK